MTIDPGIRSYLSEPRCAVVSTIGADGAPHQAVVHYLLEHDSLIVNARVDRQWAVNLARDPRVSIVVHDAENYLHWVGIKGVAERIRDGDEAVHDAMTLARRYAEDPEGFRGQDRVSFRITPRRVFENKD